MHGWIRGSPVWTRATIRYCQPIPGGERARREAQSRTHRTAGWSQGAESPAEPEARLSPVSPSGKWTPVGASGSAASASPGWGSSAASPGHGRQGERQAGSGARSRWAPPHPRPAPLPLAPGAVSPGPAPLPGWLLPALRLGRDGKRRWRRREQSLPGSGAGLAAPVMPGARGGA